MTPPTQAEDSKRQGTRSAPAPVPTDCSDCDVVFQQKDSQTNVYPATPAFSLACQVSGPVPTRTAAASPARPIQMSAVSLTPRETLL
ncbi:Uncharacterised protein [Acinetobacter baumannii]|nr:Uncharacterised protein [Acinetobacter baumannii]